MPTIRSGFSSLRERQEKQSAQMMSGDFIPYMRLVDDGDMVTFRIVSEHNEERARELGLHSHLISADFHRHEALSSKGRKYFTSTICGLEEDEDGMLHGHCELCDGDIRRSLQFMVWVWVFSIMHKKQNSDVNNPWKAVKVGAMQMYEEPVNKFMIWQDGYYSQQALESRIDFFDSITDRNYRRIRRGAPGDRKATYELINGDPSDIPADILESSRELPDLFEVALGNVRTMSGAVEEKKEEGAYEDVSIPESTGEIDFDNLGF